MASLKSLGRDWSIEPRITCSKATVVELACPSVLVGVSGSFRIVRTSIVSPTPHGAVIEADEDARMPSLDDDVSRLCGSGFNFCEAWMVAGLEHRGTRFLRAAPRVPQRSPRRSPAEIRAIA